MVKVQDHDGQRIKTGRLWVQIGDHNHRYTVPDHSGVGPRRVFRAIPQGFWPGSAEPLPPELYARVSTHDQQTLGLPDPKPMIGLYQGIVAGISRAGPGHRLWGERSARTRVAVAGRAPSRGRCPRGLAARSLGSECGRPDDDAPGIDRPGRRLRVLDRGAGLDHPDRSCHGRLARCIRRVRAGDPPRAGPRRDRPGSQRGPRSRPPSDGVVESRRGPSTQGPARQPLGDRAPPWHRPDLSAEDLGRGLKINPTGSGRTVPDTIMPTNQNAFQTHSTGRLRMCSRPLKSPIPFSSSHLTLAP